MVSVPPSVTRTGDGDDDANPFQGVQRSRAGDGSAGRKTSFASNVCCKKQKLCTHFTTALAVISFFFLLSLPVEVALSLLCYLFAVLVFPWLDIFARYFIIFKKLTDCSRTFFSV